MIEVEDFSDDDDSAEVVAAQTRTAKAMREESDMDLRELIESLGGTDDVEFRVYRRAPKSFEGINIEGHLETFTDMVTEEDLRRKFGGGTYQVKIFRPNARGAMVHFKAKSVKIPGNPDMTHYKPKEDPQPAYVDYGPSESEALSIKALESMERQLERNKGSGFDPALMQALMSPLQAQLQSAQDVMVKMQQSMAEKDARIMELITAKPDTSAKDDLVNKMFDTETSRTNSLREMHASEMRQLRESHREDVKRMDDRHKEDIRSREDSHRREIENLQRSMQAQIDSNKVAYDARVDGLKSEIDRLNRDLTSKDTELTALRARKDKTLPEQAAELSGIAESFKSLGIIRSDDVEEGKWYEKIIGAVSDNPDIIRSFIQMPAGGAGPTAALPPQVAAPQPQQGPPPVGVPFQTEPGGEVLVRTPDDQIVPFAAYQKALAQHKGKTAMSPKVKAPSSTEVSIAISFIENAFRNGTEAKTFAMSARSAIPNDILAYLEAVGVDEFLNSVAKLEQGSPLRSQAGREYVREVGQFLLEGVTSDSE